MSHIAGQKIVGTAGGCGGMDVRVMSVGTGVRVVNLVVADMTDLEGFLEAFPEASDARP